jgi:hypothetical protein
MPKPAQPSSIGGTSSVCSGANYQYSTNSVNNASGYTWTVPTGVTLLSGQGTTSITVQFAGTFANGNITVFASNCSGNSNAVSKTISRAAKGCGASKMDDGDPGSNPETSPDNEFSVSVYPNPFTEQFHLKIESTGGERVSYKIYDVTGKTLQEVDGAGSDADITLMSSFASGIYFIQVRQGDKSKVVRIVKSR